MKRTCIHPSKRTRNGPATHSGRWAEAARRDGTSQIKSPRTLTGIDFLDFGIQSPFWGPDAFEHGNGTEIPPHG
eukprot:9494389-Pyramimonas_sp.AAC.1